MCCKLYEVEVVLIILLFLHEGEVLAKQLATLGAKLIISARNEPELERVKNQISGTLYHILCIKFLVSLFSWF